MRLLSAILRCIGLRILERVDLSRSDMFRKGNLMMEFLSPRGILVPFDVAVMYLKKLSDDKTQ